MTFNICVNAHAGAATSRKKRKKKRNRKRKERKAQKLFRILFAETFCFRVVIKK